VIQEFLAVEELRLTGDGSFLLGRADDPEWRQVIQFYSAGLEQRQANAFFPSSRNATRSWRVTPVRKLGIPSRRAAAPAEPARAAGG
jgi:hypothetical protein